MHIEMDSRALQRRRAERARARRRRRRLRLGGLGALGALAAVAVAIAVIVLSGGTGDGHASSAAHRAAADAPGARSASARTGGARQPSARGAASVTAIGRPTGRPGDARAPILMYHVINPPPAGAPYPGLYVPAGEFAAQMRALAHAGYHAVTLDDLRANWRDGARLPSRPIVITFDNGYLSQYTNARPVLRALHWPGVENIQLSGLPPSQGGMTSQQVRGLIDAGWELDTQGISHADLPALDPAALREQVDHARAVLRGRYHVPVNWFCYPSGQYDPRVVAVVRDAGFVGSTSVVPGWASRTDSAYALPRLRVLGGTSPAALLAQIAGTASAGPTPASYLTSTP